MNRRGQFQMGFSMIFSIIVIIAIVAVSIYVILHFLDLGKCSELGFFYDGLQNEVDKAWKSVSYGDEFVEKIPKDIEYVCFGSIDSKAIDSKSEEIKEEIDFSSYRSETANVYLYPSRKACDGQLASNKIDNVLIDEFWCVKTQDGRFSVRLEKDSGDNLVRLNKD